MVLSKVSILAIILIGGSLKQLKGVTAWQRGPVNLTEVEKERGVVGTTTIRRELRSNLTIDGLFCNHQLVIASNWICVIVISECG